MYSLSKTLQIDLGKGGGLQNRRGEGANEVLPMQNGGAEIV